MLCLRWLATGLTCPLMVLWVIRWLIWLFIGFFWWYVHDWCHLISFLSLKGLPIGFPIAYPCSTLTMTLSPYLGLWFLTPLMSLFSLYSYPKMFRMSRRIYPMIPKVIIHLFDRVLGVVTFQLPLDFHPKLPYIKFNGLTWYQGCSLIICLMSLCFKSQLNPIRKSKVIDPLMQGIEIGY